MGKIHIKDLEIYARHGVYREETALGQKFLVNLTLETNIRKASLCDDLSDAVDYGKAAHDTKQFLTQNTYQLLETAAERLAEALLLSYPQVERITVEIKKPWAPLLLPLDTVSVEIVRSWHIAYLSIGSNIGDREEHFHRALEYLRKDRKIQVTAVSEFFVTKPYGYIQQEDFLNGALELKTLYTPQELLQVLHDIEAKDGRTRQLHWGPRTIDLDILLYDDLVMTDQDLTIPHIEMHKREFVLKPLAQIAPWKQHPVLQKSILCMWQELKADQE